MRRRISACRLLRIMVRTTWRFRLFRIQRRTIIFEYKTTHIFPEWQRVCFLRCNFCLGHLNGKNYGQGGTHCWQNRAKYSVCQTPRAFLEYLLGEIGTNECVDDIRGSTQGQKPSPVVQRRNITDDDVQDIRQRLVSKTGDKLVRLAKVFRLQKGH
jgi:hypothetical protein